MIILAPNFSNISVPWPPFHSNGVHTVSLLWDQAKDYYIHAHASCQAGHILAMLVTAITDLNLYNRAANDFQWRY